MTETEIKERPILFSTPMVKAILDGRKTVTRRVLDMPKENIKEAQWGYTCFTPDNHISFRAKHDDGTYGESFVKLKYGKKGDILWVRETLFQEGELGLKYVADNEWIDEEIIPVDHKPYRNYAFCNIPSIHMPKWASRIKLEITSISVERLHDITLSDVMREGVEVRQFSLYGLDEEGRNKVGRIHFENLWSSINGKESWESNPWVWRIEFKKI